MKYEKINLMKTNITKELKNLFIEGEESSNVDDLLDIAEEIKNFYEMLDFININFSETIREYNTEIKEYEEIVLTPNQQVKKLETALFELKSNNKILYDQIWSYYEEL